MARIAGIKYEKTATGKNKSVTIDLKRWGAYLEDFLDMLDAEAAKKEGEEMLTLKEFKQALEKQNKVKL